MLKSLKILKSWKIAFLFSGLLMFGACSEVNEPMPGTGEDEEAENPPPPPPPIDYDLANVDSLNIG